MLWCYTRTPLWWRQAIFRRHRRFLSVRTYVRVREWVFVSPHSTSVFVCVWCMCVSPFGGLQFYFTSISTPRGRQAGGRAGDQTGSGGSQTQIYSANDLDNYYHHHHLLLPGLVTYWTTRNTMCVLFPSEVQAASERMSEGFNSRGEGRRAAVGMVPSTLCLFVCAYIPAGLN